MDFGVAKAVAAGGTVRRRRATRSPRSGLAIGTPAYMSPEQAAGRPGGRGADIYAVGVLGYEMLSGTPPFTGATPQAILAAQVTRGPGAARRLRPDFPAPLAAAIMRCLEKDPARRWPSAEELLRRAGAVRTPGGGRLRVPPAPRRARVRAMLVAARRAVRRARRRALVGPGRPDARAAMGARGGHSPASGAGGSGELGDRLHLARTGRSDSAGRSSSTPPSPVRPPAHHPHRPPGAQVWRKEYDGAGIGLDPAGPHAAGQRTDGRQRGGGGFLNANRLRIEAPGYRTLDLVGLPFGDSVIALDRDDASPARWSGSGRRPGGPVPRLRARQADPLGDYLMDRYEVTNREYKRFVDSGGYRRQRILGAPFVKVDGRSPGSRPWADDRPHGPPGPVHLGSRRVSAGRRMTRSAE